MLVENRVSTTTTTNKTTNDVIRRPSTGQSTGAVSTVDHRLNEVDSGLDNGTSSHNFLHNNDNQSCRADVTAADRRVSSVIDVKLDRLSCTAQSTETSLDATITTTTTITTKIATSTPAAGTAENTTSLELMTFLLKENDPHLAQLKSNSSGKDINAC